MSDKAMFFPTPKDFRSWLAQHHASEQELIVGYYKQATGKPSVTWEESVEEALCYGWIDGVRKRLDDEAYTVRFTPRRAGSHWSKKNIASMQRFMKEGRVQPAGLAAYEARKAEMSGTYSFEQDKEPELSPELRKVFNAQRKAWDFFGGQPPGYRRTTLHWIMSAKQEATRLRRLERVIEVSGQKKRVDLMSPFKRTA